MKRNCSLRRKLNEIARVEKYYRFLVKTAGKATANRWLAMRGTKKEAFKK